MGAARDLSDYVGTRRHLELVSDHLAKRKRITFDFETRSACDLKKAGAFVYSMHPTTRPTCLAFKARNGTSLYFLDFYAVARKWKDQPKKLKDLWQGWIDDGYEFSAHNAFFERCIYQNILVKRYGWPTIPFYKYRCTAAKAAAHALPRNLAGAGEALNLSIQKDFRGHNAVMATCKPTKQYNAWKKAREEIAAGKRVGQRKLTIAAQPEPPMFLEPEASPETWNTLYTYCKIDVRAEEKLDDTLDDLSPIEQDIWHLNQKLNWRGIRVDTATAKKVVGIMEKESTQKLEELDALTMGLVTKAGARKSILEFLAMDDVVLPDLRAKTVDDFLSAGNLSEDMKRLLEIRKALSKTSTRKYLSFMERAWTDNRVRDILMYHGASTGRDSGTGVQIHNFPKPVIKIDKNRPYAAVENVVECDADMLRLLYGDSLGILFSSILRNMIMASEGHELFVADFSKVEVAVLWWLAGNEPGLKVLRSGKDPYIYQAAANKGVKYLEIDPEGDDRQLGKAQILGCGFGMGWRKFQQTAWGFYRLKLTKEESKAAVKAYREQNAAVPEMWAAVERAAIWAVENPGKVARAAKCKFYVAKKFLWIELPSGRKLAYRDPQISWRVREYEVDEPVLDKNGKPKFDKDGEPVTRTVTRYSDPQKTLEFWAVNSKTKKWALERTWGGTLTENIVQAVARDFMMHGTLRLEKNGYKVLTTIHDEALCEKEKGKGNLQEFTALLCKLAAWGEGMPLEAKGYVPEELKDGTRRYRK